MFFRNKKGGVDWSFTLAIYFLISFFIFGYFFKWHKSASLRKDGIFAIGVIDGTSKTARAGTLYTYKFEAEKETRFGSFCCVGDSGFFIGKKIVVMYSKSTPFIHVPLIRKNDLTTYQAKLPNSLKTKELMPF